MPRSFVHHPPSLDGRGTYQGTDFSLLDLTSVRWGGEGGGGVIMGSLWGYYGVIMGLLGAKTIPGLKNYPQSHPWIKKTSPKPPPNQQTIPNHPEECPKAITKGHHKGNKRQTRPTSPQLQGPPQSRKAQGQRRGKRRRPWLRRIDCF